LVRCRMTITPQRLITIPLYMLPSASEDGIRMSPRHKRIVDDGKKGQLKVARARAKRSSIRSCISRGDLKLGPCRVRFSGLHFVSEIATTCSWSYVRPDRNVQLEFRVESCFAISVSRQNEKRSSRKLYPTTLGLKGSPCL
jgi:hypothetical protein